MRRRTYLLLVYVLDVVYHVGLGVAFGLAIVIYAIRYAEALL